jgi:hypothetical protein
MRWFQCIVACVCMGSGALVQAQDPYSLPWHLRPAVLPKRIVRTESVWGFSQDPGRKVSDFTSVQTLLVGYQFHKGWLPLFKIGVSSTSRSPSGTALSNPSLGLMYGHTWGSFKLAPFVGVTLPVGTGGGNGGSASSLNALKMGNYVRSAMDGSLFGVNYTALSGGLGAAYVAKQWTVQGEITFFEWLRTRGAHSPSSPNAARTNMTMGVHVGYFIWPQLSVGAEWRYQRWLVNNAIQDPALKDIMTGSLGVRAHFILAKGIAIRPGLAYSQSFDKPMQDQRFKMLQIDVPVAF